MASCTCMLQVTSSHAAQPSRHLQLTECQYGERQLLQHNSYEGCCASHARLQARTPKWMTCIDWFDVVQSGVAPPPRCTADVWHAIDACSDCYTFICCRCGACLQAAATMVAVGDEYFAGAACCSHLCISLGFLYIAATCNAWLQRFQERGLV
jgi:hypothetical protein